MNKHNMNRIIPYILTLTVLTPGIALAQDTSGVPPMDPFCAEHFADSHDHGRRCAVCEEEFLARCEEVDGRIDECPCAHFLAPEHDIDPTTLDDNGRVMFQECVRHGYLALPAETADVDRTPIDKEAVLAALDAAIKTREDLIKAEERLGRDVARLTADLVEIRALRAAAAKDMSKVDVAALLKRIPAIPPPKPPIKGPNLAEGVGTVAGGTVIGAGVGAGIGLGLESVSVLSASAWGGPIGLGVGLVVVLIWEGVSD